MSNKFKPVHRNDCLITPNLATIIPVEHPEIVNLLEVVGRVPIETFHVKESEVGARQYDPHMMLACLIYAFKLGVFSSRNIALLIRRDDRFKFIAGGCTPSHSALCVFLQNNGLAISKCMEKVLLLAFEMKLTTGENAGMDGSKFKANASLSQNMTVEAIQAKLVSLEADIAACHELIAEQSAKETIGDDVSYGFNTNLHDNQLGLAFQELDDLTKTKSKFAQLLPPEQVTEREVKVCSNKDKKLNERTRTQSEIKPVIATKNGSINATKKHLKTLDRQQNKFKKALTQAAVNKADESEYKFRKQHNEKHLNQLREQQGGGMTTSAVLEVPPQVLPEPDHATIAAVRAEARITPKQKINVTDPESKIMMRRGGNHSQDVNVQMITCLDSGVILGKRVVSAQNDMQVMGGNLSAMIGSVANRLTNLVTDKGYDHQYEIEMATLRGIDVVTVPRDQAKNKPATEFRKWMTKKLKHPENKKRMTARSTSTEGVFAQIKQNLGFRQTYRRGLKAISKEIDLLTIVHNFKCISPHFNT